MSAHTPMCAGQVYSQHSFYGCSAKPKVERDGKHYCGIHDPVRIAEKHAARSAKWDAEQEAKEAFRRQNAATRKEIERRAEVHDDMLAALQEIHIVAVDAQLRATYQRTALERISAKAQAAIKQATTP